jgi:hypothetical protein
MINPIPFDVLWGVVKIAYLFGLGLYLVFALVVIKQSQQMTKTIADGLAKPINLISYGHFLAALGLWLAALVML